jgi:dihydrolipoamide dehydrogenase
MFDLVVIGSGPGGYVAAIRAAQLGLKVALVDKNPKLGGTCLNIGCIPSKALLTSSHLFASYQKEATLHGIHADNLSFNLTEMMQRKEGVVKSFNDGIAFLMKKNKIEVITGLASFISSHAIKIGDQSIEAKNVIIATGSTPSQLPFLPFDEKKVLSSTGALSLQEVPKRLAIIGAGVIGVEIGSIYARLGCRVTFIEFLDHICGAIDLEVASAFQKILEKQGLEFHLSTKVESAELGQTVQLKTSKGQIEAEAVLVAVGRRPNTEGLQLQNIGIELDKQGFIPINGSFQTVQPHIYAIGDVTGQPMLAHKASEEGIIAAELIAGHKAAPLEYALIPGVIYTNPEVATIGFAEEELKNLKIDYRVQKFLLKANSRAKAMGQDEGFIKLLIRTTDEALLGAHIIASSAGEMIHECSLAMKKRLKVADLATLVHAHPTLSEAIKEAAFRQPLHL